MTMHRVAYLLGCASLVLSASIDYGAEKRGSSNYPVSVSRNASSGSEGFGFTHAENQQYTGTMYVNGVAYQVILDTGSSDTWIDPLALGGIVPPNLVETGINVTTPYVDGTVSTGPIVLADISFGPYTINNQAMSISYNASPDPDLANGLIGLIGTGNSLIYGMLNSTTYEENGRAIMDNLFEHEPNLPDYTTWLLSRSELGLTNGGILTVSEVLSNMTDILDAPQLNSLSPKWTYWVDGIHINGRFVGGHPNVTDQYEDKQKNSSENSTVATFDSGTTYIFAPEYYVHQIYGDIPGASHTYQDGPPMQLVYNVPCETKLNLSWSIGGKTYPMHPIDVTEVAVNSTAPQGVSCFGTIQGVNSSNASSNDWILGDPFLRNVYHLYGYGDPSEVSPTQYIKLRSVVDQDTAWAEADSMIQERLQAYEHNTASSSLPASIGPSYTGQVPSPSLTLISPSQSISTGDSAHSTSTGTL